MKPANLSVNGPSCGSPQLNLPSVTVPNYTVMLLRNLLVQAILDRGGAFHPSGCGTRRSGTCVVLHLEKGASRSLCAFSKSMPGGR